MSDECISIIDQLVTIRRSKGITQHQLAAAANLTQSVIARFEAGKVTPQLDTLLRVAAALDCSLRIIPDADS